MKNLIFLILTGSLVSGCASTSNISARYTPTPTKALEGYWFSNNANIAQYALIRPDGTGEICWENYSEYKSSPLVISGKKLVTINESTWELTDTGFKNCKWGFCAHYNKITINQVAAQCREIFKI